MVIKYGKFFFPKSKSHLNIDDVGTFSKTRMIFVKRPEPPVQYGKLVLFNVGMGDDGNS